jgi:hypothetical protein
MRARRNPTGLLLTCIVTTAFLCLVISTANAETRTYRVRDEKTEFVSTYHIEEEDSGTFVTIVSFFQDRLLIRKELWLDRSLATVRWKYRNITEGIELDAVRRGNTIHLTGINRGREVDRLYKIDSLPWKQQFPLDLEGFVQSRHDSIQFWAIGTRGPADMRIAKFVASKEEDGHIRMNGREIDVLRVRVSFAGLLSVIWHGDAWHRRSDGRFVRFHSSAAPGHPPTLVELLSSPEL